MNETLVPEFSPIKESLERIHLGEMKSYGGLLVFPLLGPDIEGLDYALLQEAYERGWVKVQEEESAKVEEILLDNTYDQAIFALDGEELVGAKQNRVLNTSLLVPSKSKLSVPVSCVEQGRWGGGRDFRVEEKLQNIRGRAKRVKSVAKSMIRNGTARSNQREVWEDISSKESRMSSYSPTSDMDQLYQSNMERLNAYEDRFKAEPDQIGIIFAIPGLVGLELFDRQSTFKALLKKILRSYSIEAIEDQSFADFSRKDSVAFLKRFQSLNWVQKKSVGSGEDWRSDFVLFTASALVQQNICLHLGAYITR